MSFKNLQINTKPNKKFNILSVFLSISLNSFVTNVKKESVKYNALYSLVSHLHKC